MLVVKEVVLMEQHTFSLVVQQYARLLEDVISPDEREAVTATCERLKHFIKTDEEGWNVLVGGGWSARVQQRVMNQILHKIQASELIQRFLQLLIHNRRLRELLPILSFYERELHRSGRELAFLTTAHEIDDDVLHHIEESLSSVCPSGVLLSHTVDPSLLGGGVLLWKEGLLDGSIKTLLNSLTL